MYILSLSLFYSLQDFHTSFSWMTESILMSPVFFWNFLPTWTILLWMVSIRPPISNSPSLLSKPGVLYIDSWRKRHVASVETGRQRYVDVSCSRGLTIGTVERWEITYPRLPASDSLTVQRKLRVRQYAHPGQKPE